MSRTRKDLTGQTFGRWTVLEYMGRRKPHIPWSGTMWLCQCECGKQKEVHYSSLIQGKSKSCGCLRTEGIRAKFSKATTPPPTILNPSSMNLNVRVLAMGFFCIVVLAIALTFLVKAIQGKLGEGIPISIKIEHTNK